MGTFTCLGDKKIILFLVFTIYNALSCILFNESTGAKDEFRTYIDRGNKKGISVLCPHLIRMWFL